MSKEREEVPLPSGYPIPSLERYSSKSNISAAAWVNIYERFHPKAPEEQFPLFLAGDALEWYGIEIIGNKVVRWETIRHLFLGRFQPKAADPVIKGSKRTLQRGKSVHAYFTAKTILLRQAGFTKAQMISFLTDGLPIEYHSYIKVYECQDLEAWLRIAQMLEADFRAARHSRPQPRTAMTASTPTVNSRPNGKRRNSRQPRTPYHYCKTLLQKDIYHWHRECPNRRSAPSNPSAHLSAFDCPSTSSVSPLQNQSFSSAAISSKSTPIAHQLN